jgi:predicted DNA-binding transcriptional regulator AlpA
LRRSDAAAYVGVSPSQFDIWIHQKIMPKPKKIGGVAVWDRIRLDAAFDALPGDEDTTESLYDELVT